MFVWVALSSAGSCLRRRRMCRLSVRGFWILGVWLRFWTATTFTLLRKINYNAVETGTGVGEKGMEGREDRDMKMKRLVDLGEDKY